MAHSIQAVGDKFVIFRDGELMDLIALVREELERTSGGYEQARQIVATPRTSSISAMSRRPTSSRRSTS